MLAANSFVLSSLLDRVRAASALALSCTLCACVVEEAPPRRLASDSPSARPGPSDPAYGAGGAVTGSAAPGSSPTPMLVTVDTDEVMNADPGQGVGVFAEYAAGGKWHLWWTCDSVKSQLACDVAVSATAASGTIDAVNADELQGGFVTSPDPSRVEARSTTTTEVHGIRFKTNPGAVITLEATIVGLKEGPGPTRSFFFFVQDRKINGGYTGPLTNPLQLQGKVP